MNDGTDVIAIRFMLQNEARRLSKEGKRVRKCLRILSHKAEFVELRRRKESANFGGLQTCGSVWDCAVCATRITEGRSMELDTAVGTWVLNGGYVYLATYTLAHDVKMSLKETLGKLQTAFRAYKSGRGWQKISALGEFRYSVRAVEITIKDNGWHPHIHELVFADPVGDTSFKAAEDASRARWITQLRRVGGSGIGAIAYHITRGDLKISEYIAKYGKEPIQMGWTLGRETAKAAAKKSTDGGRTPSQLLADSMAGDKKAAALWVEYSATMYRKNQLVWSKGLREAVGMGREKTDEELAEDTPKEYAIFAQISAWGWTKIITLSQDVRADLLRVARTGDVTEFLEICQYAGIPTDEVLIGAI